MQALDWDDLRYFQAALDAETLSQAAKTLGVAQATMSRRVGGLEERLGHILFDRSRGGLTPTDAAFALAPHVEAMRASAEQATAELAGLDSTPSGVVRLAVPPGVAFDLIPPLLPMLRERAPDVSLEVLAGNRLVDLARRDADVAIRSIRPTHQDLVFRRLPAARAAAFAHPDYAASLPKRYSTDDVDWIQYTADMAHIPFAKWVTKVLNGRPPAFVSDNFLTMRQVALACGGAMVLPTPQANPLGLVELKQIRVELPELEWYLVTHHALQRVPRVRAVLDLVAESAQALASGGLPRHAKRKTKQSRTKTGAK